MRRLASAILALALVAASPAHALSGLDRLAASLVFGSAIREAIAVNKATTDQTPTGIFTGKDLGANHILALVTIRSHDQNRAFITKAYVNDRMMNTIGVVTVTRIGSNEPVVTVTSTEDAAWAHYLNSSQSTGGNDRGGSGDSM